MCFYGSYVASGDTIDLQNFFSRCLKHILGRIETVNQTLAKQISDPRYTF
jgi:hypothetical protein